MATSCNIITVHGNHYHLRFITVDGADETDTLSFLTRSSPAYLEPPVNKKKLALMLTTGAIVPKECA